MAITQECYSVLRDNNNTGIEYEYALFYKLNPCNRDRAEFMQNVIKRHRKRARIERLISATNTDSILDNLRQRNLTLHEVNLETQNDDIGPADITMKVSNQNGDITTIGISVKNSNNCQSNISSDYFLSDVLIHELKDKLDHTCRSYIEDMQEKRGNASLWFRRRLKSTITDAFIDKIRDKVLDNWNRISDKYTVLSVVFQSNSPIEYWIYTYHGNRQSLNIQPYRISREESCEVNLRKYKTSYIGFYLHDEMIAKMQVKFNNGILERGDANHYDFKHDSIYMKKGSPLSSWNVSVLK